MKARRPLALTNEQRRMLEIEMRHQAVELNKEYDLDFEAAWMWVMHEKYGFGLKRLLKLRKEVITETKRMQKYFKMKDNYPQRYKLKEIGYDVEALDKLDEETDYGEEETNLG